MVSEYLFSWDNIPGNDDEKLKEFLNKNFCIDWVKTAKIEKIDDGRTIKVSDDKNYLSLNLNKKKTKVSIKIDDGRKDELIAKVENCKLNIYVSDDEEEENKKNMLWTIVLTAVFFVLAAIGYLFDSLLLLAISVGALGGIMHEIVQSNGEVLTPKYKEGEGVFLGTSYGLIVGASVGLLTIQGIPADEHVSRSLMIQIFAAGLALKGISESGAGRVSKTQTDNTKEDT